MGTYKILKSAGYRIDDIYLYTHENWGKDQANLYVGGLFEHFQKLADHTIPWRAIPAEFGVNGFFSLYEKHFIYWKEFSTGEIGIFSILHQSMDRGQRLREDQFQS